MRTLRMEKLSEIRKVALSNDEKASKAEIDGNKLQAGGASPATNQATKTSKFNLVNDTNMTVGVEQKHFSAAEPVTLVPNGTITACSFEYDMSIVYEDSNGKPNETSITKDRLKTLAIASEGNTKNFDVDANPKVTLSSLSNLFPKATSPEKKPSGGGKTPGSPQKQPTTTVKLLLPKGESVADGWGTYTGIDENSFSYVGPSGQKGTYNNTKSGWKTSADKINAMWEEKSKGQAATPSAVTPPTTTPAAETPAAGGAKQLNQVTVACVRAVLHKASEKALAFWTGENERGRIRDLMSNIQKYGEEYASNPLSTLAQMVVAKNEQPLNSAFPNDVSREIYMASKSDLKISGKGRFSKEVAAVLSIMNQLFDDYAEDKDGYIKAFVENQRKLKGAASSATAPAQPPATPAGNATAAPQSTAGTQAAPAAGTTISSPVSEGFKIGDLPKRPLTLGDGPPTLASASIDPRIKKLATLRRLRVRSQMEAAVEASSMFGRSRVS